MKTEIDASRSGEDVRTILEALPEWFGDPAAIGTYAANAEHVDYSSFLARDGGTVVGVALVRRHFAEAAELHLIAVHPAARGEGIGRLLVEHIAAVLAADGCLLLSVHTVGPSFDNESYAQTRCFYSHVGFSPLEEHVGLDWWGPTLILVRNLAVTGREGAPR